MSLLNEYIQYLKNNPEGYWFKRKLYGWGWTPAKWQGWFVLLVYIIGLIYIFISVDVTQHSGSDTLINFAPRFIFLTLILIFLCYKKGEKPKWQWGIKKQ